MNKDNIIFIMTDAGMVVGLLDGEYEHSIKIKYPLKLVPQQGGGAGFVPYFLREEWIIIRKDAIPVQLEVGSQLKSAYEKARAEIFSNIIMP